MSDDHALTAKPNQAEFDGFDGYEEASEGEEEEQLSSSLIVGDKIQFDVAQVWVGPNGEKLPPGLELLVVKVLRVVQKWGPDNKPIADCTRILEPHEKWPDLNALNAQCPQSERLEKFGKLQEPWGGQRLVYLVDQRTMARYTWPSPKDTVGSRLCVNDIVERTNLMRKFNGAHVYPVVELSDTFMRTAYGGAHGGRQRPHFIIKRWVAFGGGGGDKALPPAEAPKLTEVKAPDPVKETLDQFAAGAEQKPPQKGMQTVKPPTAEEVIDDEILF